MASPSLYQSVPFGNVYPPGNSSANGTIGSVSLYGGYQTKAPSSAYALLQLLSNQDNVNFFLTEDQQRVYARASAAIFGSGDPTPQLGNSNQFYIDTDNTYLWWKYPTTNTWQLIFPGTNLVSPNKIPRIQLPVTASGNNQAFANEFLVLYNSDRTLPSVFRNGVLIESFDTALVQDVIYINTWLNAGDQLTIIATANAANGGGSTSTYGDANVAAFLPQYSTATYGAAAQLGSGGNIYGNGLFLNRLFVSSIEDPSGNPYNFGMNYSNANVANYLPVYNGNISANYYTGNGRFLTGLPAQYGDANVAQFLPNYTGNVSGNVAIFNNYIGNSATFTGNVTVLGNLTYTNANNLNLANKVLYLANGATTSAEVDQGGIFLNGANATLYYRFGNSTWNGSIGISGPSILTDNLQHANGANWVATDFAGYNNYSNSNVTSYLPTYTGILNNIAGIYATGNIQTAQYLLGNGAFITGLPAGYSNSNVASYLANYTGNIAAGNILTNNLRYSNGTPWTFSNYGDSNVRSLMSLGTLVNIVLSGNISSPQYLLPSGANALYGNPNVATYLPTYTGALNPSGIVTNTIQANTVTTGNILTNGYYWANGQAINFTANYSNANVANFLLTGQQNITVNQIYANGFAWAGNGVDISYSNGKVASYLVNGNIRIGNTFSNYYFPDGTPFTGGANSAYTPYITFAITANGNNQVLSNTMLFRYPNKETIALFKNGSYVSKPQYEISGNLLTFNANLQVGDNLEIISLAGGNVTINNQGGGGNYSNANVAAYLPTYTGNIGGNIQLTQFDETSVNVGNVSGTITPNAAIGTIYTYRLTGNITLNTITNVQPGTSMTIILQQDNVGNRLLTSSWLFAGNARTLTTTANASDIVSVFYSGSQYYAVLTRGYQ